MLILQKSNYLCLNYTNKNTTLLWLLKENVLASNLVYKAAKIAMYSIF